MTLRCVGLSYKTTLKHSEGGGSNMSSVEQHKAFKD